MQQQQRQEGEACEHARQQQRGQWAFSIENEAE
jgi:hypothetical protein